MKYNLESYSNGLAYLLSCGEESIYFQGEDALTFEREHESFSKLLGEEKALARL